jgi:hypothetical protein
VDMFELVETTTSALLLEVKARHQFVFPSFIRVKCQGTATIEINGSVTIRNHNFDKKIDVNEHLSERNGFKLIRALFNLVAQLAYVVEGKCVVSIDKNDFYVTYNSGLNGVNNSVYKSHRANRSKISQIEQITNNGINEKKHTSNFILNVTEFTTGDTLNGAYTWSDEPLVEMDVALRMIFDKIKNRTLKECQGHNVSVAETSDNGNMVFLDTLYRRYVLSELNAKRVSVYVSLTTNPKRLSKLHYVLQTIDMRLVNNVFLTLPRKYRGELKYNISHKLAKRFQKLRFLSIDRDIGPASKILPLVQYMNSTMSSSENAAAVIILIDDDNVYDGSMVSTLVYYSLMCGVHCAIAASSWPVKFWKIPSAGYPSQPAHYTDRVEFSFDCKHAEVFEAYAGALFRPRHFDLELFYSFVFATERSLYESCILSDDLLLSYVLSYSNVSIIGIKFYGDLDPETRRSFTRCGHYHRAARADLPYFEDRFALHKLGADGSQGWQSNMNEIKYRLCYQNLIKNFLDFQMTNLDFKSRDKLLSLFKNENQLRPQPLLQ